MEHFHTSLRYLLEIVPILILEGKNENNLIIYFSYIQLIKPKK